MSAPPLDPNRNLDPSRNQAAPGVQHFAYPQASRPINPQSNRCQVCHNVVGVGAVRLTDGIYHTHCALTTANSQIALLTTRIDQIMQSEPLPLEPSSDTVTPLMGLDELANITSSVDELNARIGRVETNIRNLREGLHSRLMNIQGEVEEMRDLIPSTTGGAIDLPEAATSASISTRWDAMSKGARHNTAIDAGYKKPYFDEREWTDLPKAAKAKLSKVLAAKD